jgi:hypothetical protein
MAYDLIVETDWMEKHNPHINFKERTIQVREQTCKMDNVCEDLIHECVTIEAFQLEQLLTEEKMVELTA